MPSEGMSSVRASKRPTISDVAERAGTSKGTVSFVLNGRPGVAPATRERVLAAIDELGFRPSQVARSLATSHANAIGLVVARSPRTLRSDSFFASFIAGVESGIADADSAVLLRFVPDPETESDVYRRLAHARRVDGVIVTDLRRGDNRPALLEDLDLPAVTLNRPDVPSRHHAVCNDDTTGIIAAAEHLVRLGHRDIARVGGPAHFLHTHDRARAWHDALTSHGLAMMRTVDADFTAESGAHATRELLDVVSGHRPTAIVYDNDTMAMAGIVAAHGRGVDVPRDVSVVGFDDAELAAFTHPTLTTVRTDPFQWGETAAHTLLKTIQGTVSGGDVHVGPSELIRRESTGLAPH